MWERLRQTWFPALCFLLTLGVAGGLGSLVFLAPALLEDGQDHRLVRIFAQDSTVRRTALASALGLAVTAFVFFRPGPESGKKAKSKRLPPSNIAGA